MSIGSDGSLDDTPFDGSGLRQPYVKTVAALDAAEFENITKAHLKYLSAKPSKRLAPFKYAWFLKLHGEMFGDVWDWAGKPRITEKTIGIPPEHVPMRLGELELDIEVWDRSDPIRDAATIHHRAVFIHPFENGNGRWARLLANIWLKQAGCDVVEWPEASLKDGVHPLRARYIECLRLADNYNIEPFIDLHKEYLRHGTS